MDILSSLAGAPIDIVFIYEASGGHYNLAAKTISKKRQPELRNVKPAFGL